MKASTWRLLWMFTAVLFGMVLIAIQALTNPRIGLPPQVAHKVANIIFFVLLAANSIIIVIDARAQAKAARKAEADKKQQSLTNPADMGI